MVKSGGKNLPGGRGVVISLGICFLTGRSGNVWRETFSVAGGGDQASIALMERTVNLGRIFFLAPSGG